MYEATQLPIHDHSLADHSRDIDPHPVSSISSQEIAKHPRPIVARSNEERRGKLPRNLYAVKVYDRRNGERRKSH